MHCKHVSSIAGKLRSRRRPVGNRTEVRLCYPSSFFDLAKGSLVQFLAVDLHSLEASVLLQEVTKLVSLIHMLAQIVSSEATSCIKS